jgi:hypothetical protein
LSEPQPSLHSSEETAGRSPSTEPPYYVVVFTSQRTTDDPDGYEAMADAMADLASKQPGYLGIESARGPDGLGITVSYWATRKRSRRGRQWPSTRLLSVLDLSAGTRPTSCACVGSSVHTDSADDRNCARICR